MVLNDNERKKIQFDSILWFWGFSHFGFIPFGGMGINHDRNTKMK